MVAPETDEALDVQSVIVPPAPPLLKAVPIELLLIVWVPVAGTVTELLMNVTEPVVLTFKFVNVLELMFCESVAPELIMYVCAFEPATECVIPRTSLPVTDSEVVAVAAALDIPTNTPPFATA